MPETLKFLPVGGRAVSTHDSIVNVIEKKNTLKDNDDGNGLVGNGQNLVTIRKIGTDQGGTQARPEKSNPLRYGPRRAIKRNTQRIKVPVGYLKLAFSQVTCVNPLVIQLKNYTNALAAVVKV